MATRRPHVVVDKPAWWHSIPAALIAAVISGSVVFAITWGGTQQKLKDHDDRFAEQAQSLNVIKEKLQDIKKSDDEARSKIRDEFLKRSEETSKGIADLNTKAAVQETKLTQMVETLKTISSQLDSALHPPHGVGR